MRDHIRGGQRRLAQLAISAVAACAALGIASAPAGAATSIGQTAPAGGQVECGVGNFSTLQRTEGGPPLYAAPFSGVITAWQTRGDDDADGGTARLQVWRATGVAHSWLLIGRTGITSLATDVVNSFPTRIPVQSGDRLGMYTTMEASCIFGSAFIGDTYEFKQNADPPPGATQLFATMNPTSFRVNIAATLEPDCDGDGLGDETQDGPPFVGGTCKPADLLKAKKKGKKLLLTLRCAPGGGSCSGNTISLESKKRYTKGQLASASARISAKKKRRALIKATSFSLASGQKKKVKAKLTKAGRKLLKSRRKLRARATLSVTGGPTVIDPIKVKGKKK